MSRFFPAAVLLAGLLSSCTGEKAEEPEPDAGVAGLVFLCGLHVERSPCEQDQSCVWAESDDGKTWCLPKPPDCRMDGCEDGTSCVQDGRACVPGCAGDNCCVPIHQCQHVDGGEPIPV